MKSILIAVLMVLPLHLNVFSQNRICGWETEKITSIEIEFTFPNNETEINVFNDRSEMNTILSFLKNVEFRTLDNSNMDVLKQGNDLKWKISFQGQRDQVYLFKNFAHIGKTTFIIDPKVIDGFDTLIDVLTENQHNL